MTGAPRYLRFERLTKAQLLVLPEGHWIISNAYEEVGELHIPRVLQQLPPTDEREALWSEFRGVLAGRMAFVFERLEDARSFFGFDGLKEWGFEA